MAECVCVERREGRPRGGPLSPLLANPLLDGLDKDSESRGRRFRRYADDRDIHGKRVMESVTAFLEGRLSLRVNHRKSAVTPAAR